VSRLPRLPFRHQLTLATTLASAVSLLLASVALLAYEAARSRREVERDLRSLARVIGTNSTAALAFGDARAAGETLESLSLKPQVVLATLYAPSGPPLATYRRPGAGNEAPPPVPGAEGVRFAGRSAEAFAPVVLDGETIGTVFVKSDVEDMAARIKGYAPPIVRVMLFSALVGLALTSRLQGAVSRPILQLSAAARAVADTRDYSVRVPEAGPRELRTLTATFNAMLARIEEQDAALRTARDELEERVRERVRELQHEIQEREQVQAALRTSEDKFRSIVETTRDWIWAADAQGRSTYSNPAVERILGYAPAELMGRSLIDLVHPEDRPRAIDLLRGCLDGAVGWTGLLMRMRHREGGYRNLECAGAPILGADGRVTGFQGSGHDTTERRLLEEQLRQSQKMEAVGRLAGGVAHDFNNLLGVILGYSELLEQEHPDGPGRPKVEEIRKAAERAAALTRQLLAFSRKQVLDLRVVDLNAVLADTASMLRRLIGEDIDLQIRTAPDLGRVRADPSQIGQVLMNLAVNARDAMPKGGRLVLRTANVEVGDEAAREPQAPAPGRYVTLTVSDQGRGMAPDVLSHVFEPFFTTKEIGKGTGLGLATVYGIVKQSGGSIAVQSTPGTGTTFVISLPRVEAGPLAPRRGVEAGESAAGSETVLLVEDEASLRALAREILEANGYQVIDAGSGAEALAAAARHAGPIHALLTDVVMPGMSGPELAEHLRSRRRGIAVLFMSGYTDDFLDRRGALSADTMLLQKPFTGQDLTLRLREVLARTRA